MTSTGVEIATSTYGYDHQNSRVSLTAGGITTIYVNKLYSTNTASTTKHIFAGNDLVAVVERTTATTTHIIHIDHLGGTNAITNADGTVVQTLDYYPYGSIRLDEKVGSFSERRKFIGQEYDIATALSYLNARYYEGSRGQFLSQDPVFWQVGSTKVGRVVLNDPQLMNSYGYSRNNPLRLSDPDGEMPTVLAGAFVGAGIGLGTQFAGDALSGQWSSWQTYAGAAAGGAVQGAFWGSGAGILNLAATGIASGLAQGGVREGLEWALGDPNGFQTGAIGNDVIGSMATNVGGGLLLKYIGVPQIARVTSGRNSYDAIRKQIFTKLQNETINNVSLSTQAKMGISYGINSIYSSGIQALTQAVQSYNSNISPNFSASSHNGGSSLANTHWVTPSGAVVTWEGQLVSGPMR